jgi:DNA-binding NarL/FixJ family response regulator
MNSIRHADQEDSSISAEERLIITLIVVGYSNRRIARHLSLSESTICRRVARILGKLGVDNRFELVLYVIDKRIVDLLPNNPSERLASNHLRWSA